jgi:hypothetical protein
VVKYTTEKSEKWQTKGSKIWAIIIQKAELLTEALICLTVWSFGNIIYL